MKTQPLSLDLIRLDGGTQSRLEINQDTVEDYAEILAVAQPGEWPFPPLDVFHDGKEYFAADGFHRCIGAKKAGRSSAPCVIHQGSTKDARIFGMTANDRNGLRMTRWEKRSNVEWLLDNGGKMPQKEIAEKAGVSVRLVKTIVSERNPVSVAGKAIPPKQDSKGQSAPHTPSRGEPDPFRDFDPSDWPDTGEDPPDEKKQGAGKREAPPPPPASSGNGKPPKKYDRSFWYKQWNTSIGPLCRLVEKIADNVGEKHGARHKGVKESLESATQNMIEWMGVKR
jgi:hypothetical protein